MTFEPTAEITLEANPSGWASSPSDYRALSFNRVSIGIQSLDNTELKRLSRTHTAEEALYGIRQWQNGGFENISIDLMYGLPGQTLESWQETLTQAIKSNVSHLSLYGLKVEDSTPLAKLQTYPAYTLPDEDIAAAMFEVTQSTLSQAGYERYEVSNWAKPGYESGHNLNYWAYGDWLALGLGSHGYWQGQHYETTRDLSTYLKNPLTCESHKVSPQEALENTLFMGLRRTVGLNIPSIDTQFSIDFWKRYGNALDPFLSEGHLIWEPPQLKLTPKGILLGNLIFEAFIDTNYS